MAKTYRSKKQKGKRLEQKIASRYRQTGLFKNAQRQLLSGGSYLKGDIYTAEYNEFVEEVKNQETVKLNEWWKQTVNQATSTRKPVLHISANYRPILSVIRQDDLVDILWELEDYGIKHLIDPVTITKSRMNLWNEWIKAGVETAPENSFPVMYLDREGIDEVLAVLRFEDLLDLRVKLKQERANNEKGENNGRN